MATDEVEDGRPDPGTGGQDAGGDSSVIIEDGSWGGNGGGTSGFPGLGGSAGSQQDAATGACTPGDLKNLGTCFLCGTSQQTCSSAGVWGTPICVNQGTCNAGDQESQGCGSCGGTQTRTCQSNCTWGQWSACSGS